MGNTGVNRVIEEFERLPLDDKEYVSEVLRRQVIESRRERLVARAQEAKNNLDKGFVRSGALKDLLKDLESA